MNKKKVLFCQFGGLGEFAVQACLEEMGFQVMVFCHKTQNYDYDKTYLKLFADKMEKQSYDVVFSINFFPIVSKVCQIYKTTYISWIYDSPELHLYSRAITNSVNRIFIFDRMQYQRFAPKSPDTIFYMPLATQPMTDQDKKNITKEEQRIYGHDICFIGSLYNEKDKRFYELSKLPDYWRGYVEGLVRGQFNVYGYNLIADSLSEEAVRGLKNYIRFALIDDYDVEDREILADVYIGPMCSALERDQVVRCLAKKHKITLYTGADTSGYVNVDNKGFADSITMMPKIFHCSKINLNITSKTIQTGIPLRVFDVLGSEGFLITNYQAELCQFFEPDVDLVVYDSMENLAKKVDYYMKHEDERKQIAYNGYQKVCQAFTYKRVLADIMQMSGIIYE